MFFVALLIAATTAIAGSAAFFSVYGLAYTFSGVFWSTVVMGASLEGGKLIAASYLYRYWNKTHVVLKTYLFLGILALMTLTSTGIFGYLSSGYQQDALPLKQKQEQVQLLTEDRERALARKKQIDDVLAGGPAVKEVTNNSASIRSLREVTRSRESTARQYKQEQQDVTKHIADLDKQLLELKTDLIKTEAHIGPITYIAKVFSMPTDDATKYLIYLIIFAFDPMAIALTLAVNLVLKEMKEEKDKQKLVPFVDDSPAKSPFPLYQEEPPPVNKIVLNRFSDEYFIKPAATEPPAVEVSKIGAVEPPVTEPPVTEPPVTEPPVTPAPVLEPELGRPPRQRAYEGMFSSAAPSEEKIGELMRYHRSLRKKIADGEQLSKDELWEKTAIEQILRRHNLDIYLN